MSTNVGWPRRPLGEVIRIVARQVDPRNSEFSSLPHINGENIVSRSLRLINVRSAAEDRMESGKYLFDPGDVLYSKLRPNLCKVAVVDFRGLCSADMYPIKTDAEVLDPQYLAWLLLSEEFTSYAVEQSRRARMPKLNREQLFSWQAPLPSLKEQRHITATIAVQMSSVEKARLAVEDQLEAAEALNAACLRSMFNRDTMELWPLTSLGSIAEIVSGVTLGRKLRDRSVRSVPYLRVANVKDGRLDLADVYRIDATESEIAKLRLRRGDILLLIPA